MLDWLADYYLWIKAFHIISVIAWMAGLLYLPRLFVYHAATVPKSEISNTFLKMEYRLSRMIMLPAMILSFSFGSILLLMPSLDWHSGWLHIKLFMVLILAGLHGYMVVLYKEFLLEKRQRTPRFFRIINEIPAVIMIIIVVMAVVKPF
ncbi:MAG: protoporphyrinogen oxidase HemJ [Pseudomonadota bacterium]